MVTVFAAWVVHEQITLGKICLSGTFEPGDLTHLISCLEGAIQKEKSFNQLICLEKLQSNHMELLAWSLSLYGYNTRRTRRKDLYVCCCPQAFRAASRKSKIDGYSLRTYAGHHEAIDQAVKGPAYPALTVVRIDPETHTLIATFNRTDASVWAKREIELGHIIEEVTLFPQGYND